MSVLNGPALRSQIATTSGREAARQIYEFLEREQQALNRDYHERFGREIQDRIEAGDTLGPLRFIGIEGNGTWTFELASHHGRFREGDYGYLGPAAVGELAISRGTPVKFLHFDATACVLTLQTDAIRQKAPLAPSPSTPFYFDERKVDLTNLYRKATYCALESAAPSKLVRSLILGGESNCDDSEWLRMMGRAEQSNLDESQCQAFALQVADPVALVQGPPGTGKTFVLANVVASLIGRGCPVLVCAMTHRAVNKALNDVEEVITKQDKPVLVMKLGDQTQSDGLSKGIIQTENRNAVVSRIAQARGPVVVGTSVTRVPGLVDAGVQFGCVIFDEAGQLTLAQVLCGAIAAPRAMLFGDHKQLPPIMLAEHPTDGLNLNRSAFEIVLEQQGASAIMLETSYRLNKELSDFPSRRYYDGRLRSSSNCAGNRLNIKLLPHEGLAPLLDPSIPLVWGELPQRYDSLPHNDEAFVAASCVRLALQGGIPPDEIAVISPFRLQNQAIRWNLVHLANEYQIDITGVKVDTVERMQGQERELVIVSLGLSDPAQLELQARFAFSENRLNVSVTRAKSKCIVLGSNSWYSLLSSDPVVQKGIGMFRDLLSSAERIPILPKSSSQTMVPRAEVRANGVGGGNVASVASPAGWWHRVFRRRSNIEA